MCCFHAILYCLEQSFVYNCNAFNTVIPHTVEWDVIGELGRRWLICIQTSEDISIKHFWQFMSVQVFDSTSVWLFLRILLLFLGHFDLKNKTHSSFKPNLEEVACVLFGRGYVHFISLFFMKESYLDSKIIQQELSSQFLLLSCCWEYDTAPATLATSHTVHPSTTHCSPVDWDFINRNPLNVTCQHNDLRLDTSPQSSANASQQSGSF